MNINSISYHEINDNDITDVVKIHLRSFSGFFLSELGIKNLEIFYKSLLLDKKTVFIGCKQNNQLLGFLVANEFSTGLYKRIFIKNFLVFLPHLLIRFIKKPSLLFRMITSYSSSSKILTPNNCEASLLSICIDPNESSKGIGKELISQLDKRLADRNISAYFLTTDAKNNDYVNQFYIKQNFTQYSEFLQGSRLMNVYIKKLKMKIPFSPPYVDESITESINESLNSGWITTGPKVREFEEELSRFTHSSHTICVNSWSSGAMLVLKWFGITEGDEVIVPAYTYSATALAVLHCGAKPVMVDIGDDFTINTSIIEDAITERTKIIMPVDIAGWPCDYDAIYDIIEKDSIKRKFTPNSDKQRQLGRILLLSDAAHSIGAMYKNKAAGILADITIFSFHAVKNITTAEGGAIALNLPASFDSNEDYKLMKLYTLNGQNKDAFSKTQGGGWRYDILFAGLKVNMPDICAAIGLEQLRKYPSELLPKRKIIAEFYQSYFEKFNFIQLPILKDEQRESCYHIYALRFVNITEQQRDNIIDEITKLGIAVNVHFIPMPMFTLFKGLGYDINDYPSSFDNYSREISLPIYPQLKDEQLEYICQSVISAYNIVIK